MKTFLFFLFDAYLTFPSFCFQNIILRTACLAPAGNPSTWEGEIGGCGVQGNPQGLQGQPGKLKPCPHPKRKAKNHGSILVSREKS